MFTPAPIKAYNVKHIHTYASRHIMEKKNCSRKYGRFPDWSADMFGLRDETQRMHKRAQIQVYTGVQRGTRACYRVTHNTVTCVIRHKLENAPMFQQVQPPRVEN